MDIHSNCVWKDKKYPETCTYPKHKEKCHCDLEPCVLYEKRNLYSLLKMLKIKFKNRDRRKKKWLNLKKLKEWKKI